MVAVKSISMFFTPREETCFVLKRIWDCLPRKRQHFKPECFMVLRTRSPIEKRVTILRRIDRVYSPAAESGTPLSDVCRQSCCRANLHSSGKKYAHPGCEQPVGRQLEEENS